MRVSIFAIHAYWIDHAFKKKTDILCWGRDRALGLRIWALGFGSGGASAKSGATAIQYPAATHVA